MNETLCDLEEVTVGLIRSKINIKLSCRFCWNLRACWLYIKWISNQLATRLIHDF